MTPPARALGEVIYSLGFRLNPSPHEAVNYYLRRINSGEPLHEVVRRVIHHADVYACEPAELARRFRPMPCTGDRFFFSPCKKQHKAVGGARRGSWNGQNTVEIKDGAGVQVGELRKLRYKIRGVHTDWLMDEYSLCGGDKQQQFVFCKVYVSPRAAPSSAAHHESAAFFAPLPPTPTAVIAQPVAKKTALPPPQPAMPPCALRTAPPPQAAWAKRTAPPPQAVMPTCTKRTAPPLQARAKRMRGPVLQPAPQPWAPPAPIRSPFIVVPKSPPARSVTQTRPSQPPIQAPATPIPTRPVVEPRCSPPCLAEEQTVAAAPDPPPPSTQFPAAAPALQEDDDDDDLVKALEEAMLTAEAEEAAGPDPPQPSTQFASPALQEEENDDDLVKALEDAMSTAEANEEDDDWEDLDKELGLEE